MIGTSTIPVNRCTSFAEAPCDVETSVGRGGRVKNAIAPNAVFCCGQQWAGGGDAEWRPGGAAQARGGLVSTGPGERTKEIGPDAKAGIRSGSHAVRS
ncbi:hypothetical protein [Burkholderia arboris]|uniref:hypothetical protein n=1 Tax=Burkholderia arboris TaxID=488730 RepID=UPI0015832A31|nr:hypothetical protein [Burkholderia arboris]